MYENDNNLIKTNKKPKSKKVLIAILCISLGLLIGVGGTITYYSIAVDNLFEESNNQQSELSSRLKMSENQQSDLVIRLTESDDLHADLVSQLEESINQQSDLVARLTESESEQSDLESHVDYLTAELYSLNTDIKQLSYLPEATGDYNSTSQATNGYSENIQNVAEAVMPSVVGVRTIAIQTANSFFYGGGSMSREVEGVGTGVIVSEDGLILTNQHVVSDNPKSITVTLIDGIEYDAEVIYSDESMDLAVIKIDATGLPTAELGNSDGINVGEITVAIGNPLGLEYERSVTAGIISAIDRVLQLDQYEFATNLIQTDAAINSGNSGGPLLNASGQVIGINTYKLSSGEGMGFAIPINAAIPIVEQVIESGKFVKAKIGANLIDVNVYSMLDESQITELELSGIAYNRGLLALDIKENSNAYVIGLRTNDILISIDGYDVNTLLELRTILYSHLPGDTVTIKLLRNSETLYLPVVLYTAY